MRGLVHSRIGHIMVMFGFFLGLCTLMLHGVATPKTIAFGTGELASLSNQYRANAGIAALTTNSTLTSSAQAKANHMANNSYFAHDAPDGTSPWYFFGAAGYSYSTAGENLALSNQTASSVVTGWYDSPGHRANMLNTEFSEVGYGIAFVSEFTYQGTVYNNVYLVAAHYAKPLNPSPPPAPAPVVSPPAVSSPTTEVSGDSSEASAPAEITPPAETPEAAPTAQEPIPETPAAPVGFELEPENTSRSGEYSNAESDSFTLSEPATIAGIGGSGALVLFGGGIEIRRLLKHQPVLPKFHK